MTETDLASGSDESFTAEEQAFMDAYERGEDAPAAAQSAPQAPVEPVPGAEPAAQAAPAGEAPGDVVDPDAPDADDPEKNRGRFVRHGAFHKEREGRKAERARAEAAETALNEMREKFARGDERLRVLNEAFQGRQAASAQPAAEAPKVPTPEEDIFGAYHALKAEFDALKGGVNQQTEAQRVEREQREVLTDYQTDARRFMAAEPTFGEAYNHLVQSRAQELALAGVPQDKVLAEVAREELEIAAACRRAGVSPAERIFAMAKIRGFVAKAPEPAAPATPAASAETATQKAERIAAGQAGPGKSLSAAGGAPAGEVTLETLAGMSEKDFEAFANKNPDKLARLMGAAA